MVGFWGGEVGCGKTGENGGVAAFILAKDFQVPPSFSPGKKCSTTGEIKNSVGMDNGVFL